jgi:hypothetical protein
MGWSDVKAIPPPAEGVWHKHDIGCRIIDWHLRCGAFNASIRLTGDGPYFLTINLHPYPKSPDLTSAMRLAEETLVRRVEAVLPAYLVIKARLDARVV